MPRLSDFSRAAEMDEDVAAFLRRPIEALLEHGKLGNRTWRAVDTAARTLDLATLRDFCSPRVEEYLRRSHGAGALGDAVRAIARLMNALGDDAPAPKANRGGTRAGIQKWAEELGVADLLPLEGQHFAPRQLPQLRALFGGIEPTLLDLLAVDDTPPPRGRAELVPIRDSIVGQVRERLRHISRNRDFLCKLETRHPRIEGAESEPGFAELAAALRRARETLGEVPPRIHGWFVPAPLAFEDDPPRLVYDEAESADASVILGYGHPDLVAVRLDRLGEGTVEVECSCFDRSGCGHRAVALDAALDLLARPSMPARAALREHVLTPPWQRLLDRIEQGLQALPSRVAAVDQRLIWEIRACEEYGQQKIVVSPVIQRRGKNGGWLRGARATLDDLEREPALTADPADARILEILSAGDGWAGMTAPRTFHAIEALTGAPNVFLEGMRESPVAVKHLAIAIAIDETEQPPGAASAAAAGYALSFRLGDAPISPGALLDGAGDDRHVILLDPEANVCRIAAMPPEILVLVRALTREPALTVPAAEADRLLARLERVQAAAPFVIPDSLGGVVVEADRRFLCRLRPLGENGLSLDVRCRPLHESGPLAPGEGPRLLFATREGKRVSVQRDLEGERAGAHQLIESLGIPETARTAPWRYQLDELELALDVVAGLRQRADVARDVVVEWPEDAWKLRSGSVADMRIEVSARRDWFGVEGGLMIDGELLSLATLMDMIRKRRRWVALGGGRFARIEDELRRRLEGAEHILLPARGGVELGAAEPEALARLVDDPFHLVPLPSFEEMCERRTRARQHQPVMPEHLRDVLRPYQITGFEWLSRLAVAGSGALLADDMGLGKTLQLLTVLQERAGGGPALVVAPTSVVHNWASEAARFAPGLRCVLYRGSDRAALLQDLRPGDLVITSYALALRDAEALAAIRFSSLVLDEAQAIKNAHTRRARAIATLQADWRIALTGTPIENHLGELWSLFRVVSPALLGSWQLFRERFGIPIERYHDSERRAVLASLLRPFLLRRTKQAVAPELPSKTELDRLIDLSPVELGAYEAARIKAVQKLTDPPMTRPAGADPDRDDEDDSERRIEILAELTRLRQLACATGLVDPRVREPSSKLRALVELLVTLKETGHRALVFSQFVRFLTMARDALEAAGLSLLMLDGSTPAERRATLIQQFQAGAADAFLISLKAGGTGLNLTEADYVVHLDPWWNPAVEDQATDRTHRIGQTRPVTVVRLIARGTVEESVLSLHAEKRQLASSILEGADGAVRLSNRELMALLAAGADADLAEEAAEDATND